MEHIENETKGASTEGTFLPGSLSDDDVQARLQYTLQMLVAAAEKFAQLGGEVEYLDICWQGEPAFAVILQGVERDGDRLVIAKG